MLALLRMVEAKDGRIVIDDVDISTIGLHDLRSRVAIIPQEPVLFSASLRRNLDPFDRHSDTEIWHVLECVGLQAHVQQLPDALAFAMAEGGENFSVGQRQLICMARALLRKPRILLLDEATASIDVESDAQIQVMLRRYFRDVTVLTVAHRLKTVMDSDRILVLDGGKIAQYGAPEALLQEEDKPLFQMANAHGKAYASMLMELARTKTGAPAGGDAPPSPPSHWKQLEGGATDAVEVAV